MFNYPEILDTYFSRFSLSSNFCIFFRLSFVYFAQFLRSLRLVFWSLFCVGITTAVAAPPNFQGIGRPATAAEVKAWDIDVRPDFKGLPKGQGTVSRGETVWEAQCASCHGSFAESNEVFTPLVGYTTARDVQTGRVASLQRSADAPTRTSMMKVSQLSTLWDYISRAMPWTAPKSLSADDVYAVTAYMLHLANVVPADYTLSDSNIADTQKRIPNRLGMHTAHAMWPGKELKGSLKPDVQGSTCTQNCVLEAKVTSFIPDYARDAHGNLAEQSRTMGGSRGAVTLNTVKSTSESTFLEQKPATLPVNNAQVATKNIANMISKADASGAEKSVIKYADVSPILQKFACAACHSVDTRLVGPSFQDIVRKQRARSDAAAYLASKIKAGGQGVYGQIPMPAQQISDPDAHKIVAWILQGANK